ncbi:uroporphyrinogen-III C-methyltransferase [Thermodesulfobacteriota bacterium]
MEKSAEPIKKRAREKQGKAYLVGAGPGDPELMTLKGIECLKSADVVIYDYLANRAFLDYARKGAELIYVGKKGGSHTMKQKDINSLIASKAMEGNIVVRLKGGDPFIFGRGGEEAEELVASKIPFEIVPGITSAIAVPAYAGIPLTHRDYTATVAFITGHEDPEKGESNIAWDKLATGAGTLVFLMGVGNLPNITKNLIENGRPADTPVAVIHRGTISEQRTVTGQLKNISEIVKEEGLAPPAIIVVGEVVGLREKLIWFENRPLFGKRIVVTRAREQASEFQKELTLLGAECIEFPTIEVAPPDNWEPLDTAIQNLAKYQWLVFTSVNGVKFFLQRLEKNGRDVRDLKGLKIGTIGPKTAEIWHSIGIKPDLIPDEYRAEAVVSCFNELGVSGVNILLPRASKAREILPEELKKMGAHVDVVHAYKTVKPESNRTEIIEMFKQNKLDMVTFTSSSTVENFIEMLDSEKNNLKKWMEPVAVACIGPITAEKATENEFKVSLVPSTYTLDALTEAIIDYFSP